MRHIFPSVSPWKVRVVFYGGLTAVIAAVCAHFTVMPGQSADSSEPGDPRVALALQRDVRTLVDFGPRNFENPKTYESAGRYLKGRLEAASGRVVTPEAVPGADGTAFNYFVEWGAAEQSRLIIVGAHYDTASGTPGANDNGTGVAVLLHLATRFRNEPPSGAALRLVLFANEEPPYFWTEEMGSLVHARGARRRGENVVAMLSLETMGHYSEERDSQKYPPPFGLLYPSEGNFLAFVGNMASRQLVARSVETFRSAVRFPSEGGALPSGLPGIGWSDHWSFWQEGYPALMVTDTAPFRDSHYHEASDRGDQIDFGKLSVVARGLEATVRELGDSGWGGPE